ncbi:uncharacterized protein LOC131204554 [Ahaetulla prasina]|uniref:uncharacterized protein LOC131204554 n=1 Tax=Ahaetulla prasina TaxID=499056 RepID=UPI0026475761|nr:uncharacterized protein LOC131204554 [Ahaetulla prasina]
MPENESTGQIRLLPCTRKRLFLSLAAILAILCKGIRSQKSWKYSIIVDSSFSVQRGLVLHIPCQFTYNQGDLLKNDHIYVYWIKYWPHFPSCFPSLYQACNLVATNNPYRTIEQSAKDRFHLLGDSNQGNCSLVITNARIEDEGRYYLRIEGKDRIRFSFFQENGHTTPHVYVIEPPRKVTITVNIEGSSYSGSSEWQNEEGLNRVIVKEGNTVNLICTADGRPPPNLSWMKENQKIGEPERYLQLREIGPEDAGKYWCLANHQNRSTIKTMVEVIVQYRPRMLVFNTTQTHRRGSLLTQGCSKELASASEWTAEVGDSLELFCKADGNPPATTSWVKRDGRLQKPPDNQLRLTNLTVEDEGVYVCKAKNVHGDTEGTFRLYVTYAPKLRRSPHKNTTCYYHDNGVLCTCTLHAKPPPQIEWEVDGERITEESRRRGNWTVQPSLETNEVTSTLNWTGSLDRAHNIICMGSNSYGIQSVQFLLNAKRDPTSESSIGKSNKALFIAGLCGIFLGVGIFLLCLFLIRVFKQKKALLEASHVEGTSSGSELQEKPNNSSHIYSNVFPMGPRLSPADKPKPAGERKPKVPQVSTVPAPKRSEPRELQYAALDFKPKSKGVPDLSDNNVEYSSIQRKYVVNDRYNLEAGNVSVEEGLCAVIPCIFTYIKNDANNNNPVKGFWKNEISKRQVSVAISNQKQAWNRFQIIGDLTAGNCSLLILNAQKNDTGEYLFRMEKEPRANFDFRKTKPYLKVTERQLPKIQIAGTMKAGHSTSITCATSVSCSWMPPTFIWNGFPELEGSRSQLNGIQIYSSVLNFTPSAADHNRNITCRVNYTNETNPLPREKTVQLNVIFKPQMLGIKVERFRFNKSQENFTNVSQLSVHKGDCIQLRCNVNGNPSPKVTWTKGSQDLGKLPQALNVLKLSDLKLEDAGTYTCHASNEIGTNETSVELFVTEPKTTLLLMVTGTLIMLAVIMIIIGIIFAYKRYRWKSKRVTVSETGNSLTNVKKPNTSNLATQEMNGISPKPRSTDESMDGDPEDSEEIHYASITFNAPDPKPDITAEDVPTDYAEIRPCSSQEKET